METKQLVSDEALRRLLDRVEAGEIEILIRSRKEQFSKELLDSILILEGRIERFEKKMGWR